MAGMTVLPASVRLALWTTARWAEGGDAAPVVALAHPGVDHVAGDLDRLALWHSLGERALLVALPAPGDLTGVPAAPESARAAAAAAGECVFVPSLGGMLVPAVADFGHEGGSGLDAGTRVDWQAYAAEPVPRHRVHSLDAAAAERHLREQLIEATEALQVVGGQPFNAEVARNAADAALGGHWGLPSDVPPRALRAIELAATVTAVVDLALEAPDDALDASTSTRRRQVLLALQRTADRGLAEATSAACAVLAGWQPA
jgi:hypothetical protein